MTQERVRRLVEELLTRHVDILLVFMAEARMPVAKQRQRMEGLVGLLLSCSVEATLEEGGRRVVSCIDTEGQAPVLRLNGQLLSQIDDGEVILALARTIADVLRLSPVSVGLVLKERDEGQLKALYTSAARNLAEPPLRLTQISAAVTQRLAMFQDRLVKVVTELGGQPSGSLHGARAMVDDLGTQGGDWPEFLAVQRHPFVSKSVVWMNMAINNAPGLPPAAALVELCWESLNLSFQSFMRKAARALRGLQGNVDHVRVLRALVGAIEDGAAVGHDLSAWPAFAELHAAWGELWAREQFMAAGIMASIEAPAVSIFEAPRHSMGLSEPESLPWDMPLVCWTLREQAGLRDLLVGMGRSLEGAQKKSIPSVYLDPAEMSEPSLTFDEVNGGGQVSAQIISSDVPMPDGYQLSLRRALEATFSTLLDQFEALDLDSQRRANNLLHGGYMGFLAHARPVWKRRFSGYQEADPVQAFAQLVVGLQQLLRVPILFNPFDGPQGNELQSMPAFNVVVAVDDARSKIATRLPLVALRSALGVVPIRLRIVEVPEDAEEPCLWVCDHELRRDTLKAQASPQLIRAIHGDNLCMVVDPTTVTSTEEMEVL